MELNQHQNQDKGTEQKSIAVHSGRSVGVLIGILLGIAVVLLLVNAVVKKDKSVENDIVKTVNRNEQVNQNPNSQQKIISLEDIDVDVSHWKTYRNEEFGFIISYPKENRDGTRIVAVETLNDGNVVYIIPNDDYREKISDTTRSQKSDIEKTLGIPWAIIVRTVDSDKGLESFIRERYGSECKLGEMKPSAQTGVYDVSIKPSSDELGIGCFINWISVIKYSPQLHKVAAWDIGQDANFYRISGEPAREQGIGVDLQIANSFRFLDR